MSRDTLSMVVGKCPSPALALTNHVFLHPTDFKALFGSGRDSGTYVKIGNWVWTATENAKVDPKSVGFNNIHRTCANLGLNDPIEVQRYRPEDHKNIYLSSLTMEVDYLKASRAAVTFDGKELEEAVLLSLDLQVFCYDQRVVIDLKGTKLQLRVTDLEVVNLKALSDPDAVASAKGKGSHPRGLLTKKTSLTFNKAPTSTITIKGSGSRRAPQIKEWDFKKMEIGGLDAEFSNIFRRAFASRCFPQHVVEQLGIKHIKGILLYGPPGTGKTLMARQIGKMLNAREPKIVQGPEILNKYVGQAEENIRNLFVDAEREYKEKGDDSELHIIIFDEIDAICKQRGSVSSGTGVHDTIVNQLLTKIDGVESLNNILVIGMTNRKDMLDEALMRPGRFEVQVEIGLPDERGRVQIFTIHTNKIAQSGHLGKDVDLLELAQMTKNYTGAEIEGVVKAACSYAFNRQIDVKNIKREINPDDIIIGRDDFMQALQEVKSKFGVSEEDFDEVIRNGIIDYGPRFRKIVDTGNLFIQQVRNSDRTPLLSVLLEGPSGSGKTALAAHLAMTSGFPHIKLLTPDKMVGYAEPAKVQYIQKVFTDSYKSPMSVIVVDDVERLLEFVRIGPRFSNAVLQTLMVLYKKTPEKGRKLLILSTTSNKQVLDDMGMLDSFHAVLKVPCIEPGPEVKEVLTDLNIFQPREMKQVVDSIVTPVAVKKLLMIAEMAQQGEHGSLPERFIQCLADYTDF